MVKLTQTQAAIARFIQDNYSLYIYYNLIQENFTLPAIAFENVDRVLNYDTLHSHKSTCIWFAKIYMEKEEDALFIANDIVQKLWLNDLKIPIYDANGNMSGENLVLSKCLANEGQIQFTWNEIYNHKKPSVPKIEDFNLNSGLKASDKNR